MDNFQLQLNTKSLLYLIWYAHLTLCMKLSSDTNAKAVLNQTLSDWPDRLCHHNLLIVNEVDFTLFTLTHGQRQALQYTI